MVIPKQTFFKIFQRLLLLTILIAFFSCEEDDNSVYTLSWKDSANVSSTTTEATFVISGEPGKSWIATIIEGSDWCSFSKTNASLNKIEGFVVSGDNEVTVFLQVNQSEGERTAYIEVLFEGRGREPQVINLTQTLNFASYTETPSLKSNADYRYVTHYTNFDNRVIRNYSICYDINMKGALWVAYPIHATYLGKTSRTNEWKFDPEIEEKLQSNCVNRSYNGRYERGHQIASGDRTGNRHMNAQTFYMTNITPQLDRLNQDMWAILEGRVRSYNCSDTLFVVTGAYYKPKSIVAVGDGRGNQIPRPTHYYKVLLRTRSGNTGKYIGDCKASELKSIGFWVEHKDYGNIAAPSSTFRTVEEIEELTGFEFFPLVDKSVKQQMVPRDWAL